MKWLKSDPRPHQTALAMIGVKPGQQVLILGAGDGGIAAAVAAVTGLNGRTLVIDPAGDSQARVEAAAAEAGALVEFAHEPLVPLSTASGMFDVVVLLRVLGLAGTDRDALIGEAVRATRLGGRVIVIEGEAASGLRGLFQRSPASAVAGTTARDLLAAAGLRAARVLSETAGITYVEAARR